MNVRAITWTASRSAVADFLELTKPRLSLLVLFVVGLSGWLAGAGHADLPVILEAILGTALVAGGSSAINMLLERRHDEHMQRTVTRPIPSGRVRPREALVFGVALIGVGLTILLVATTPLAAGLAAFTAATYLGLYTPLKRLTTLNTHIGAIPGALPALIGWAAVRGDLDPGAWTLFLIVFVWQIPHFLSIAWLYREDYERGGFRMLPIVDPDGRITGRQALLSALALIPVSLLPTLVGVAGLAYFIGAVVLGVLFARRAAFFALGPTEQTSRRLMRASLFYLPLLLALLFLDSIP